MCSGRVSRSCSISGTRRVNLNTKPVISHKWTGKYLRQVEITCKKLWYPCVTFHLYFLLFTMRKYVRSLLTNLSFFSFVFSFLLVWWLFSDQHYYFTWKTRPTSVHCFHHHSSFSVLWHSVYVFPAQPPYNHNISMSAFHQVSSHKAD